MNERPLRAVMEEMSEAAMDADVADRPSLELLAALFGELRCYAAIESGSLGAHVEVASRCLAILLRERVAGPASGAATKKGRKATTGDKQAAPVTPEDTLRELLRAVADLQKALSASTHPASGVAATSAIQSVTKRPPIVLPDWVERATLDEYTSAQLAALDDLEAEMLAYAKGGPERLATLKRRLHTMKGEAGVVGLDGLAHVCHAVEDFLEAGGPLEDQVARLLEVKDWIKSTVEAYSVLEHPVTPAEDVIAMLQGPAAALVVTPALIAPSAPKQTATQSLTPQWDAETVEMLGEFLQEALEGLAQSDQALLNVEQDGATPDLINGLFRSFHNIKGTAGFYDLHETTALAHATETLLDRVRSGTLELQGAVLDVVLDATEMTRTLFAKVRAVIGEGAELTPTEELNGLIATLVAATEGRLPPAAVCVTRPGARLGEILEQRGLVSPAQMATALERQQASGLRLGEELLASGTVRPKAIAEALRAQRTGAQGAIKETIRIDVDRVDGLVEMIGELVIVQSLVNNIPEIQGISSLKARTYLGQLTKITRDLQGVGLRMRMMPVRGVFQKMSRMVHDLSRKSNKEVRIVLAGDGVEMDRGMVDLLGDPLVHMIRNSVDHGVESAEERAASGKPAVATVRLSAYHETGNVVIEIADDGRGLNRDAILAKARAQGLVNPGREPSDAEIWNFIFAPGFSTAKQVTEISGRGVGMDVVKRQIEDMRGRVIISSTAGRGTTFKLILPLTLAIIDGMLIACGVERYIIPTLSIVESIQPDASMLFSSPNRGEILNLRGEILPLVRLDRMLDIPGAKADPTQALVVVIDSCGNRLGLVVDDVLTKQQVVIKSLGAELHGNHFLSGAAILGDGRVGFILDVQEIGRLFGDARRTVQTTTGSTDTRGQETGA